MSSRSSSQIGNFRINGGTLGIGTTSPVGDLSGRGHIQTGSVTVPKVNNCGTSPSIAGSDHVGRITIGDGVISSCVVAFSKAWTNNPSCFANDETAILLTRVAATTTGMTLSVATAFQNDVVDYLCFGYE